MPYLKKLVVKGFKSFARETEIPLINGMNVIVGPNGSGKSCEYSTLVKLSDGQEIKIGKLVEDKINNSKDINKLDDGVYADGDDSIEILSLNKNTGKIEKKTVSKFIKRKGETLYRLTTKSGKEVKATGCHPVMTFKDGEIKSVLIRNLDKKSLIAAPRVINIEGEHFDEDLSRFIGYIIGDGYISSNRIEFVNNDIEIIEDYKNILKKFKLSYSERIDKNIKKICINDSSFYKKIKDMFIENHKGFLTSEIKKIPDYLLTANKEAISNLLAGLYDTDGSARKDIAVIEFCTKNKLLAEQIQGLLLRYSINSRIKKRYCYAENTKDKIKRDYYYLYIYGAENFQKFYKNIPLKVEHKTEIIAGWANKFIKPNPNAGLLPRELNFYIKELSMLLGIKYKPLRKKYSLFAAYIENRCSPSREGLSKILEIFKVKLMNLTRLFHDLNQDKINLINCMDELSISGIQASKQINLHDSIIRSQWSNQNVSPRQINIIRFHNLIKETFQVRFVRIKELMSLITMIASSDILWDEVVSIEKLGKPDYVYDLTIEENHNFIANNIFVHNSNITDAVCFVLGRLSSKSMRADKISNLIFAGTKMFKPASEASVKLVFDNSDRAFSLEVKEVNIERLVRRNGQGIYKINGEVKTRQEVLELMATAGIDPYGFNLILQGEINSIVKMNGEERRKVIEEVAGISVYETRKEKSIHELEKTDEKLKEVSAILRERKAYLRNLEEERKQALKFKQLEETMKKCKASILHRKLEEKKKEAGRVVEEIEKHEKSREKIRAEMEKIQQGIFELEQEINSINTYMQSEGGAEQEKLREEISNLRADLAGLTVKKDSNESRLKEVLERRKRAGEEVQILEKEINELRKHSPLQAQKFKELEEKKKLLSEIEKDRKTLYNYKEKLNSMKALINEKERRLQKVRNESDFIIKESEKVSQELVYRDIEVCKKHLEEMRIEYKKIITSLESSEYEKIQNEKTISVYQAEIANLKKIQGQVSKIDICPLCKSKITPEHVGHVSKECDEKIIELLKNLKDSENMLETLKKNIAPWREKRDSLPKEISHAEISLIKLKNMDEKKEQIKSLLIDQKSLESEIKEIEKEKLSLENKIQGTKDIEDKYDKILLEIQEVSSRTEQNLDVHLQGKEMELEKTKLIIKQSFRDEEDLSSEVSELTKIIDEKETLLSSQEDSLSNLEERFEKSIEKKDALQAKVKERNIFLQQKRNELTNAENNANNLKIDKARQDAECENLELDFQVYKNFEIIPGSVQALQERLTKAEFELGSVGSVNLRALEVYDSVKSEYDAIEQKSQTLENEKIEILKIIEEIDRKKKRTFIKTLIAINELFSRNFIQLSTKGEPFLELENPDDPFSGGLNMTIRVGKGKYFDVTGLSGGEQTLMALSLIFAIQEHRPYCFYIFDEVDAALDKRNSEKLADLIKRYMRSGQYVIVTHNDALITASSVLYGISMQEGISQLVSLEI